MPVLLKDMPEHAEKIESSYSLQCDLKSAISDSGVVKGIDSPIVFNTILPVLTAFINQNYINKKDYGRMMDKLPASIQEDITDAWEGITR